MNAETRHNLIKVLNHMKDRCYNKNDRRYKDWGGRGITICQEWLTNSDLFVEWAEKSGYKKGLTIDRIDNNKGYSPDNCRWVTIAENNQNRRSSRWFTINGETKNLQQWCDFYNVPRSMVNARLENGWDIETALLIPKRQRNTDNIIGKQFGFLTVEKFVGIDKNRQSLYQCKCICGNTCIKTGNKLKTGHTKSCGCMHYKSNAKK